ncbi:OmpA family protein [Wenyingzhuangia sp. IMCC45533]
MLKKITIVFAFLITQIHFAQNKTTPWALTTGVNIVDILGGDNDFKDFLGTSDWNMIPLPTKISLSRYLNYGLIASLGGSLNSIEKVPVGDIERIEYQSVDLGLKYDINSLIGKTGFFNPYIGVNGGMFWLDGENSSHVNPVAGFNLWMNEKVGVNFESGFKYGFTEVNNHPSDTHFQHSISVIFKFGARDKDKDGVVDKEDLCPEVFGLSEFSGCPDTDSDGIEDSKDDCPTVAGTMDTKGCPDADGDGVKDAVDECPNRAGTVANKGCPDIDGDGVKDSLDKCPNEVGSITNKGCPDTDGDGILDKDDKCINQKGLKENKGCPETGEAAKKSTQERRETGIDNTILFDYDSYQLTSNAKSKLMRIATMMKTNPNLQFRIEGNADSIGTDEFNIAIGQLRAQTVSDYLIENGISKTRLKIISYGEERPIATNETEIGRQRNRRVVIQIQSK